MKDLIRDVFPKWAFKCIKKLAKNSNYQPIPATTMWLAEVPDSVSRSIRASAEKRLGKKLKPLATFFRYNCETVNITPRIHSDGLIQGEYPDYASVTYLRGGGSGTAFFKHPEYGDCWQEGFGRIHEANIDDWSLVSYQPPVDNAMLLYSADLFHCRYPFTASADRFVIVQFLKVKE